MTRLWSTPFSEPRALFATIPGVIVSGVILWGVIVLGSGQAHAAGDPCQPRDGFSSCFSSDNLWLYPGQGRFVAQSPTQTAERGTSNFALFSGYLHRPIGLRVASADPEGTTIYAVEHAVWATLMGAVAIHHRLQLQIEAPFLLWQDGAGKADVVGSDTFLPRSAIGDLRFGALLTVLKRKRGEEGLGAATRFEMSVPTGQQDAFASSRSAAFAPGLSIDWTAGPWSFGADVGARIRQDTVIANTVIGSQLSAGLGVAYEAIAGDMLSVHLETFALIGLVQGVVETRDPGATAGHLETEPVHMPAEWLLSVQSSGAMDGQLHFTLGGGSFIPTHDSVVAPVTTPAFRVLLGMRYTPAADE